MKFHNKKKKIYIYIYNTRNVLLNRQALDKPKKAYSGKTKESVHGGGGKPKKKKRE